MSPQLRLVELLRALFSGEDLRRFVRLGPEGMRIAALLPEHATLEELATQVVELLIRRGELDAAFFARLVRERPRRAREIAAVRRFVLQAADRARPGRDRLVAMILLVASSAIVARAAASWSVATPEPVAAASPASGPAAPTVHTVRDEAVALAEPTSPTLADAPAVRSPGARPRTLTREALLELLRARRPELLVCERAYAKRFGPIPAGKYRIDFSTDRHGRLQVGRPSEDMMSEWACFRDAFTQAGRKAGTVWRAGSPTVSLDLEAILAKSPR